MIGHIKSIVSGRGFDFLKTETGRELFFYAYYFCDAAPFETSTMGDAAAGRRLIYFLCVPKF